MQTRGELVSKGFLLGSEAENISMCLLTIPAKSLIKLGMYEEVTPKKKKKIHKTRGSIVFPPSQIQDSASCTNMAPSQDNRSSGDGFDSLCNKHAPCLQSAPFQWEEEKRLIKSVLF